MPLLNAFGSICPNPSLLLVLSPLVWDPMVPKRIQQREEHRAERDDESRCVRARLDGHDEHLEGFSVTTKQHDLPLSTWSLLTNGLLVLSLVPTLSSNPRTRVFVPQKLPFSPSLSQSYARMLLPCHG